MAEAGAISKVCFLMFENTEMSDKFDLVSRNDIQNTHRTCCVQSSCRNLVSFCGKPSGICENRDEIPFEREKKNECLCVLPSGIYDDGYDDFGGGFGGGYNRGMGRRGGMMGGLYPVPRLFFRK